MTPLRPAPCLAVGDLATAVHYADLLGAPAVSWFGGSSVWPLDVWQQGAWD